MKKYDVFISYRCSSRVSAITKKLHIIYSALLLLHLKDPNHTLRKIRRIMDDDTYIFWYCDMTTWLQRKGKKTSADRFISQPIFCAEYRKILDAVRIMLYNLQYSILVRKNNIFERRVLLC